MPLACTILEQFELLGDDLSEEGVVLDDAPVVEPETIAGLRARVAELQSQMQAERLAMAQRLAELEPSVLIPLKTAAIDCDIAYETARRWCHAAAVTAERDHGRWFADPASLSARKRRLSGARRK
jgi:hypothetical protein